MCTNQCFYIHTGLGFFFLNIAAVMGVVVADHVESVMVELMDKLCVAALVFGKTVSDENGCARLVLRVVRL
ncbi:hypothetical protein GCM10007338_18330 [Corynebacterium pelargi]|nr:hypothetical protein GCM10007338_18330 [Corynebacterium pelargi]